MIIPPRPMTMELGEGTLRGASKIMSPVVPFTAMREEAVLAKRVPAESATRKVFGVPPMMFCIQSRSPEYILNACKYGLEQTNVDPNLTIEDCEYWQNEGAGGIM